MRKHFKDDGYQLCKERGGEKMQSRYECLATNCTKIHC